MTKVSQLAVLTLSLAFFASTLSAQNGVPPTKETPKAKTETLSPPSQTAPVRPTGTAATVNGQALPEVAVARALLNVETKNRDKARPEILNRLIDNILVDQYLAYQKISVDMKEVDSELEKLKSDIKKHGEDYGKLLSSLLLTEPELKEQIASQLRWDKFVTSQAPDEKLKAYFDQNLETFDGTLVRARHILITPTEDMKSKQEVAQQLRDIKVRIETEVAQAIAKLPADADNLTREQQRSKLLEDAFAKVAKEKSTCSTNRDGGDLNWFPRVGTMVEPFSKTAFALKPFQISDVMATEFGYHLILVTGRKAGQPTKFEEVKEAVKEVYGEKLREAVTTQMRTRAQIQFAAKQ